MFDNLQPQPDPPEGARRLNGNGDDHPCKTCGCSERFAVGLTVADVCFNKWPGSGREHSDTAKSAVEISDNGLPVQSGGYRPLRKEKPDRPGHDRKDLL